MSAATMSGSEAVKSPPPSGPVAGSKQSLKSSTGGKALDGARKQAASPVDGQSRKQQSTQPKAWQGPNPITQKASSTTIPNGTEKPLPKLPTSQPQTKSSTEPNADKHAHDRALYIIASFTGHDATLTLKNGEQFSGIFSGGSFDSYSKHQYILKMAKRIRLPTHQQINGATELPDEYVGEGEDYVTVFDKDDVVDLSVPDVVPITAQSVQNGSINSSFRTDTEISGRDPSMPRERELQRWDAGADSSIDMSLESSGETGWDQFAINERMYGVQSTYDENIYTTQIDRSDPRYRQREAEAARIAREIEGTAPANAHVAEERRRDADRGDGLDEEEKYSGVRRDQASALPKRAVGAYVPPSQRPITTGPTVPGAPYDPAIISSQLAKPVQPVAPEIVAEQSKAVEPSVTIPNAAAVAMDSLPSESDAIAETTQTPKKSENTAEDHIRNVNDSFKQFANHEKMRIRMAQEQKKSMQRAEKIVKLNDLKKFASNFKLKSRVPDDLVPILAKDREKQLEIQHKADEAAKEEEVKAKEREKEKAAGGVSPALSSTASQISTMELRAPVSQPNRPTRGSVNLRPQPIPGQTPPRAPAASQQNRTYGHAPYPPRPQPLPADLRIPTGPAMPPSLDVGPLSPGSATRNLNAKAFEFRPAASAFTPSGTSPSPQRSLGGMDQPAVPETADFFAKDKKAVDLKDRKSLDDCFNPILRVLTELTEEQKAPFTALGGVPQPFRTPPTWPRDEKTFTSYLDSIPQPKAPSQPHSQTHTPNPSIGQMPHAHQLPPHIQGPPVSTPSQRPQYMPQQHHPHPQPYGPGMQQFGPNGSVQSSPRFQPPQMAFNGQMQGMPMPQFAGQQMQGYGMSPSMQYRQVNMPPQGPMMMMPNQGHGQMAPMPQGYARGPQQFNPQMMGGVPMSNQPSGGGFMGGPMQQQQSYSPMPPHAQPHMQHGGYTGSPRPHMMQHTVSHQGFQQQGPMHMGQQPPHFAPSPGHNPYQMQHRQMSTGGYPQMTPRQQQAQVVPLQPSPGMGGFQGDEGK